MNNDKDKASRAAVPDDEQCDHAAALALDARAAELGLNWNEVNTDTSGHSAWRRALIRAGFALAAAPVAQEGTQADEAEAPSAKQEKLRALADRIDHEKLWKRPLMYRARLTDDQRDRLDAGVMLRRYADLMAPGRWLVLPPTGNVQFSAGSLDKVTEMAKRDQERSAAQQDSAQVDAKGGDRE